jgi:hypothetical protein
MGHFCPHFCAAIGKARRRSPRPCWRHTESAIRRSMRSRRSTPISR